jgi:hypothetical protein
VTFWLFLFEKESIWPEFIGQWEPVRIADWACDKEERFRMNFAKIMATWMLVASLMLSIGTMNANPIVPGGTIAPTTFSGGAETLLSSINGTYSNSQESGSYRASVYRNGGGTMDCFYDFNEGLTGQLSALTSTTMSMFAGFNTDVMFVVNSTSLIAPGNGFGVPTSVTRSLMETL